MSYGRNNSQEFKRTVRMIIRMMRLINSRQRYVNYTRHGVPQVFRNPAKKPLLHNGGKP